MKQEMIGWQWHQLYHMQINCSWLQTGNFTGWHPPNSWTVSKHWILATVRWKSCVTALHHQIKACTGKRTG